MAEIELTGSQVRELQSMDQAIITLTDTLTRAQRAGLEVTDLQQRLAQYNEKRKGLLREFTPGTQRPRGR